MKKVLSILLVLAMVFAGTVSIFAAGKPGDSSNFTYELNADQQSYTITGVNGTQSHLVYCYLPAAYNGKPITEIADDAFNAWQPTGMYGIGGEVLITIPESVTKIGSKAFKSASMVAGLIIPKSVTSIADDAFEGCSGVQRIAFYGNKPSNLTTIISKMNILNPTIKEIYCDLSNSTWTGTQIDGWKICDINKVEVEYTISTDQTYYTASAVRAFGEVNLEIPSEYKGLPVKEINSGFVAGFGSGMNSWKSVKSIILPNTIETLGSGAFAGSDIESITLPSNIKTIGSSAFASSALKTIEIPGTVKSIGSYAFSGSKLSSVTLSEGVEKIEERAFASTQLTSIVLPSSLKEIGTGAFAMNKIESYVIPASVTSIGGGAFSAYTTSIKFEGSAPTIGTVMVWTQGSTQPVDTQLLAQIESFYDAVAQKSTQVTPAITVYYPEEYASSYATLVETGIQYVNNWVAYNDAIDALIDLVNEIGDVEVTETCKNAIKAARTAYDALSDANKTKAATLLAEIVAAETQYKALDEAAKEAEIETPDKAIEGFALGNKEVLAESLPTEFRQAILDGKAVVIEQVAEQMTSDEVPAKDATSAAQEIKDKKLDVKATVYFNFEFLASIEGGESANISQTNEAVKISAAVPQELATYAADKNYEFKLVRIHNGVASIIDATLSEDGKTFSFESNLFSTYALVAVKKTVAPNTGDMSPVLIAVEVISALAIAVLVIKKRKAAK